MGLILSLIPLILLVFWFFMLVDMIMNKRIDKNEKILWLICFLILSIPVSIVYYFVKFDKDTAWWR